MIFFLSYCFFATSLSLSTIKCLMNMEKNLLHKFKIWWNEENCAKNMVIFNKIIVCGALYALFYEHDQRSLYIKMIVGT